MGRSLSLKGPSLQNNLPEGNRSLESVAVFKSHLKNTFSSFCIFRFLKIHMLFYSASWEALCMRFEKCFIILFCWNPADPGPVQDQSPVTALSEKTSTHDDSVSSYANELFYITSQPTASETPSFII